MVDTERFNGFSGLYEQMRPHPPETICRILLNYLNAGEIDKIVDIGCGTGLSTKIWLNYARNTVGVEPNREMLEEAKKNVPGALFLNESSYDTRLDSGTADIVTCSQSFHWMEPVQTLKEVNRILKPEGVFAVYDCLWPPSVSAAAETAYRELFRAVAGLEEKYRSVLPEVRRWPKKDHFASIQNSGYFSYCTEVFTGNPEKCDSARFTGLALSQGSLQALLKKNIPGIQEHIEMFKTAVQEAIKEEKDMYISYRIIAGIKTSENFSLRE
ncbi:class I SAM-dependent methyltransferase [Brucepastera parasyntrophica]|uniref:class I SAM-dependent methyltransferase n=1 Tax=Brucepastera parasyntrophica TaxID=2880008 RepID=UPI00210D691F|nr:class I SAM-dependent methyltransferase [Brucepastera parasyntrophica]ULQ59551.1 class I SAM-dependent methyltransferase [Brucepastera parasyntrophica]